MGTSQLVTRGEVTAGMHITVLQWNTHRHDSSWQGDVLLVEAVSLPYVICKPMFDSLLSASFDIDLRLADIAELTPEYVEAKRASFEAEGY